MGKYYYRVEAKTGSNSVAMEKHKRPQRCFEDLRQLMKQMANSECDLDFIGIVKRSKENDELVSIE